MREFIITVNSTVDLPKEWLEERHVPVLPLKYTIDGENLHRYVRIDSERVLSEIKRRSYVCDFSDQSGGSTRDA